MKSFKNAALLLAFILVVGVLSACGSEKSANGESNEGGSDNESTESLSGPITIDGSSTVFPIMEALTYQYQKKHPETEPTVNSSGSGGGFKKSTRGEIDLSNASREIKPEEQAIAKENGVTLEPLEIAKDGLSVVVSQQNDFVKSLTIEQLKQIFSKSSDATKWSDINPEWPDETIKIFSPGHDSGTFDYFNEVILEEQPLKEGENTTLSEDDNVLVRGISNDPYAIGFFGYAYYAENKDKLKVLGVDNGEGEPVKPTDETIQSGTYTPLSRPLYTYVNVESLKQKPQVLDFVKFTLENAGKAAQQAGYVALPEEKYQEQLENVKQWASEEK
ncbi:PstS family phosphate ABC transporter substrate-binding protein [Halobacillus shinanisalinarum]|uniref:Phosphate-binding protein n=1 Tax=Halobacillus shinanisalinarum TaxID=2932258 RepID=A0ABY4GZX4_9BACI|nr:PstS family phosphate ABC transporter substrate-binding protein [Halobacillus shinanisalinarum]UOQ93747.1 PstS family phosphate ABC transporter substrate-binding protein [Halobacillus shinanisalinarum]